MEKTISVVSPKTAADLKKIGFPQRSRYFYLDNNDGVFSPWSGTSHRPAAFQLTELLDLLPTPRGQGLAFYVGIGRNCGREHRYYCRIVNDKTIHAFTAADALGKAIVRAHKKHGRFWEQKEPLTAANTA